MNAPKLTRRNPGSRVRAFLRNHRQLHEGEMGADRLAAIQGNEFTPLWDSDLQYLLDHGDALWAALRQLTRRYRAAKRDIRDLQADNARLRAALTPPLPTVKTCPCGHQPEQHQAAFREGPTSAWPSRCTAAGCACPMSPEQARGALVDTLAPKGAGFVAGPPKGSIQTSRTRRSFVCTDPEGDDQ